MRACRARLSSGPSAMATEWGDCVPVGQQEAELSAAVSSRRGRHGEARHATRSQINARTHTTTAHTAFPGQPFVPLCPCALCAVVAQGTFADRSGAPFSHHSPAHDGTEARSTHGGTQRTRWGGENNGAQRLASARAHFLIVHCGIAAALRPAPLSPSDLSRVHPTARPACTAFLSYHQRHVNSHCSAVHCSG
jgi:hypothetical protein